MFTWGTEIWVESSANCGIKRGAGQPCLHHSTVERCPIVICLVSLSILVEYILWKCASSLNIFPIPLRSSRRYLLQVWIVLLNLLIHKAQQAQNQVLHWDEV